MPRPGVKDPYRQQARAQGFVARAIYKLQDIDGKHRLFRPHDRVLDLGCSPGSWLQYILSRVGPGGLVVGVDLQPLAIAVAPPLYFLAASVASLDLAALRAICPQFDVIVSDLAPKTTGVRDVDQQRYLELAGQAWDLARNLLKPGGHFLVKVFTGPDLPELVQQLKRQFAAVRRLKQSGSRAASREIYLLGLNRQETPMAAAASKPAATGSSRR